MSKSTNLTRLGILSVVGVLSLGALDACDKSKSEPVPAATEGAAGASAGEGIGEKPTMAKAGEQLSQAAKTGIAASLAAYESIRAELVNDKIPEVKAKAAELAKSAKAAAGKAHGAAKTKLDALAKAASDLEAKSSEKAEDVRKAYGEVSRAVVNLVSSDPELKKDLNVYECPMAPGYKKWVQPQKMGEKLENPYMGQEMLECGGKAQWQDKEPAPAKAPATAPEKSPQ